MSNLDRLSIEQETILREDIEKAKTILSDLARYERVGIDVTEQRKTLEATIAQNEKLLREFGN